MHKKITLIWLLMILAAGVAVGQRGIKGSVVNYKTLRPVRGANVSLKRASDTSNVIATIMSDSAGRFGFYDISPDSFVVSVSFVGFLQLDKGVRVDSTVVDLGKLLLSTSPNELESVTVTANVPMATQKNDTIQYNASQFKVNPDATAEDLAKKMPGITVQNGQVTAHGETVQKVTIDGRELFGDDATAALRNLPAEIVDKIQVFDRLSDQAQFTGVDDGNSAKGINIVTKANMRNGQFGRVFAGYGTNDTYQAGGNATMFKNDRKISLVGNFNNINQQNFSAQDLLGVTSSAQGGRGGGGGGGGYRGGGGGGGGYQGGGSNNFLVGQQNGINKTTAAGINYTDNWGKKLVVTGSYFFNRTENTTDQLVNRTYVTKGIGNYNQSTLSGSSNTNHRVSARIEYRIDSANQLIITPSASVQINNSTRGVVTGFFDSTNQNLSSRTNNMTNSQRNGNNLSNNILFRHSFAKRGRTFSVNLTTSSNNRVGDIYTDVFDTTFTGLSNYTDSTSRRFSDQTSSGYTVSGNLIYTEPLSKNSQLQVNYAPTYTKSKADQEVNLYDPNSEKYDMFNQTLSNKFDNVYKANNAGLTYHYGTRNNQVAFGISYQNSSLQSDQVYPRSLTVNKSFDNILPNAMLRLKLSSKSNLRFIYRAATSQPSVTQLQNVYDVTNDPFIASGNPDLVQQYNHIVNARYTFTNPTNGILLVGNVFMQNTLHYITNATFIPQIRDSVLTPDITLKRGQQLTKPVNLDGYISLRSFVNFAFPIKFIKSNVNFNGGVTYSKLPGIVNNVNNITKSYTYTSGVVIASNVSQYVDFNVSYSANFNNVRNQVNPANNQNYFSQMAGIQFNLLSKSGWFLQNDFTNQLYTGLGAGYNQNYNLWNMSVGKKFLKSRKAEIKAGVFDLLKQNRSISRNISQDGTYYEDVQNQVLQRYFMLTFTYNLRNFGTAATRSGRGPGFMGGGRGGMPPF